MAKTRLMEKKNSNDDGNNKNGKLIKSKKGKKFDRLS